MDAWESAYQEYRQHVQQSLMNMPNVIVISPDNDDLPTEECNTPVVIGSYEIADK